MFSMKNARRGDLSGREARYAWAETSTSPTNLFVTAPEAARFSRQVRTSCSISPGNGSGPARSSRQMQNGRASRWRASSPASVLVEKNLPRRSSNGSAGCACQEERASRRPPSQPVLHLPRRTCRNRLQTPISPASAERNAQRRSCDAYATELFLRLIPRAMPSSSSLDGLKRTRPHLTQKIPAAASG